MQHPAIGEAKIARHVAALFLAVIDAKGTNFLVCRNEVGSKVRADLLICQGVLTERLGVFSGEAGVVKIARDMEQEDQLFLSGRLFAGFGGAGGEQQARAEHACRCFAYFGRIFFGDCRLRRQCLLRNSGGLGSCRSFTWKRGENRNFTRWSDDHDFVCIPLRRRNRR